MTSLSSPRRLAAAIPSSGELRRAGFDPQGRAGSAHVLLWGNSPPRLAHWLRYRMPPGVDQAWSGDSVLLSGSVGRLADLASDLEAAGLTTEAEGLRREIQVWIPASEWRVANRVITFDTCKIVGILNVTPDSFFDGGRYFDAGQAVTRATEMLRAGASIVEVGGVKAGPGQPVDLDEELRRVIPVIQRVVRETDALVSVDSYHPDVAKAALEAGASIVNDINGFRDTEMRRAVAGSGAGIVLMHIQGLPRVRHDHPKYGTVIEDILEFLRAQIELCESAGIEGGRIAVDPGPSFGKNWRHDLELLRDFGRLRELRRPIMLAVSRKDFIAAALGSMTPEERLAPSLALVAHGVIQGANLIRTHDVAETVAAVRMIESVSWEAGEP